MKVQKTCPYCGLVQIFHNVNIGLNEVSCDNEENSGCGNEFLIRVRQIVKSDVAKLQFIDNSEN